MSAGTALLDEVGRLCAVGRYGLLEGGRIEALDAITALVRATFEVPVALVSVVAAENQHFLSRQGFDAPETPRSMAFCHYTIQSRSVLSVPDATKDPRFRFNPLVLGAPFIRSYHGAPIETPDGFNLGSLCVIDVKPREFTAAQLDLLAKFAGHVGAEIEARQLARLDPSTGALSRRALVAALTIEMARCHRTFTPTSLAVLDVDDMAAVNARHGTAVGDMVVRRVAEAAQKLLRAYDLIGRLGGDRFALVMPGAEAAGAVSAMTRLCATVREARLPDRPGLRFTASVGASQYQDAFVEPEDWIAASEAMLLRAKEEGKDRCVG